MTGILAADQIGFPVLGLMILYAACDCSGALFCSDRRTTTHRCDGWHARCVAAWLDSTCLLYTSDAADDNSLASIKVSHTLTDSPGVLT